MNGAGETRRKGRTMNMRTMVVAGLIVTGGVSGAAAATGSFALSPMSGYMWRGQYYSDEPVLQPSVTVGDAHGFSFNVWGNLDLTDNNNAYDETTGALVTERKDEFTELDLTLAYTLPLEGPIGLTLGFIQYTFPAYSLSTREFYATIVGKTLLNPTLSIYGDVDAAEGFYGNFGLSHSFALAEKLTLGLSASIGYGTEKYNAFYFGVEDDLVNDVNAGATLTYAITEKFSLTALATYTTLIDSDIEAGAETIGYDDTEAVVGGITATYTF
jgi:hypothetical protein